MTNTALAQVQPSATGFSSGVLGQGSRPCDIVGIDVQNSGFGVEGRPTPFGATVESGKHYGILPNVKRNKLSLITKLSEMFQRPLVSFSRAVGQHVFHKNLTRKWRGRSRKRLSGGRNFVRYGATRILSILDC